MFKHLNAEAMKRTAHFFNETMQARADWNLGRTAIAWGLREIHLNDFHRYLYQHNMHPIHLQVVTGAIRVTFRSRMEAYGLYNHIGFSLDGKGECKFIGFTM